MPDDTKYEYRLDRASLLRAPVGATWDHEIYRPAKDTPLAYGNQHTAV